MRANEFPIALAIIFMMPWLGIYLYAVSSVWRVYAVRRTHFTLYITDLWAAIAGLLPTFISIKLLVDFNAPAPVSVVVGLTSFLAQFLGMFYGRLDSRSEPGAPMPGGWRQAFLIVNSGLIGYVANLGVVCLLSSLIAMLAYSPCIFFAVAPLIFVPFISAKVSAKK